MKDGASEPLEQSAVHSSASRRFGYAWTTFALALTIHVGDEATHNFLGSYNPAARMIRARFPLIPIPTFTFGLWISLLVLGIVLLFMFAPLAFRAFRPLVLAAFPLAIMVGVFNAALHIGSSIYMRRWMPGVYSAPVLLIAASLLLSAGWRLLRIHAATSPFRSNRGAG